ncbi:hypothetical protein [Amycolatopsis kentuckyensis]|uniref:hypothetical protein n=1 Tax=Amycolatopsis kentuckyensis TaxID=218823 RepID=UPI000A3854BC|nr:hypothetical protein [Amycolatopsis kentuckyensis]
MHTDPEIGAVAAQLTDLAAALRKGDRADPRNETLLCLVESASRAALAFTSSGRRQAGILGEALSAARAAVTAASFALVEQGAPRRADDSTARR